MSSSKKNHGLFRAIRRLLPECIAALIIGWFLRDTPEYVVWHARAFWNVPPFLHNEARERIPARRIPHLQGAYPALTWINEHIPRDRHLLYIGGMHIGIRLRYYTYPRESAWHYVYGPDEVATAPDRLDNVAPDYLVMERLPLLSNFPVPDHFSSVWQSRSPPMTIYKAVTDDDAVE